MTDEIRNFPESTSSFQKGSHDYDFYMGWHTDVKNSGKAAANIRKMSGNSIVDVVYGAVQDESYRTILEKIGDCSGNVDQRCFSSLSHYSLQGLCTLV